MNEVNYFSSLRDKEPKLVAWETVENHRVE